VQGDSETIDGGIMPAGLKELQRPGRTEDVRVADWLFLSIFIFIIVLLTFLTCYLFCAHTKSASSSFEVCGNRIFWCVKEGPRSLQSPQKEPGRPHHG
jgi:hypothetical protein